jgi:Zn-dependent peptidase ImmA (M78 family)
MAYNFNRPKLAFEAASHAMKLRQSLGVKLNEAIALYTLVHERMGIEIHFEPLASLEGVYRRRPQPLIVVSSLRPAPRQVFTCAHEVGHHVYGHSSHIDNLIEETRTGISDPIEFSANNFAAFLLMPKVTVCGAFVNRRWQPEHTTPQQIYRIACWLGVGYTTLIWHMLISLKLISSAHAASLQKSGPKQIRGPNHGPASKRVLNSSR